MGSAPYPNQVAPPQYGVCPIAQPRDTAPARGLSHTLTKGHPRAWGSPHSPTTGHPPSAGSSLVGLHQGSPCRWPCHRRRSSPRAPHYLSCPRRRAARPGRGCPPRCSSGPRRDPPHPRGTMRAAGTWWLGLGLGAALAALSPLGSARLGATPAANPSPARPLPAEVRSCGAGAGTGAPPPPQEAAGPSSPFPPHAMRSGRGPGAAGAGQSPRETPLGAGGGEGSRAPGPPRLGTPGSANPVGRDPQPPALELWDPWDPLFGGSGPPGLQTQGPQDPGPAPWSCSTYGSLQAQSTWSPQVHKLRRLGASQPHTPQLQDPWDPYPGSTRPQVCKPRRLRTPRLTSPGASETPSLPRASPRPCPQGARHHSVPYARRFGTPHTHNQG